MPLSVPPRRTLGRGTVLEAPHELPSWGRPVPRPPLDALCAFETAARLGSFGAAAKLLLVIHSAVSHQVRQPSDRRGPRPRFLPRGQELALSLSVALRGIDAARGRGRAPARSRS